MRLTRIAHRHRSSAELDLRFSLITFRAPSLDAFTFPPEVWTLSVSVRHLPASIHTMTALPFCSANLALSTPASGSMTTIVRSRRCLHKPLTPPAR
eukprot:3049581-Rhodomonas_salina.2